MLPLPYIVAHTGCMKTLENSMESIRAALQYDADIVEIDIRVTLDGIAVLSHEDLLISQDGRIYSLSTVNFEDVSGELYRSVHEQYIDFKPIIRLEEILTILQPTEKKINLDIKDAHAIAPTAEWIRRFHFQNRAFFTGCEYPWAKIAQEVAPDIPRSLNANAEIFKKLPYEEAVNRTCEDSLATNCFAINMNYRNVQPYLLDRARSNQLKVMIWTVNEWMDLQTVVNWDVYSVTTLDVAAIQQLKKRMMQSEM